VTDRLTRITTALAVLMVASVAAVISYQHAYELVRSHGETGVTARLLPFTVDGLIWAASMFSGVSRVSCDVAADGPGRASATRLCGCGSSRRCRSNLSRLVRSSFRTIPVAQLSVLGSL